MKRNSQKKLLKKLKNLNDNSRPGVLVIKYLKNRYDLNELFKLLYDEDIKKSLSQFREYLKYYEVFEIKMIDMASCPDKEKAKELISYYINYGLRQNVFSSIDLLELVSYFKIYDKNVLKYCDEEMLIKMYKEDQNDELFNWILYVIEHCYVGSYVYYLTNLRPILSTRQKHDILNILINRIDCSSSNYASSLKCANENLLPEELEYIRMKALNSSERYGDIICQFIYDNMLDDDKREKYIDEIICRGDTKCGYKLLINANLTSEETKKLKNLLLKFKDEYYFYYLVRTNIKFLLKIFGSYLSIKYFIEESFCDSEEKKEVLAAIHEKEFENLSEAYEKAINCPVYRVKPKRVKKNKKEVIK